MLPVGFIVTYRSGLYWFPSGYKSKVEIECLRFAIVASAVIAIAAEVALSEVLDMSRNHSSTAPRLAKLVSLSALSRSRELPLACN
jgi:hypothetical protein